MRSMGELDDTPIDPALARSLDALARREMEAGELDAADLAKRQRRLIDVAWQAVQSGTRLTIRVGEVEFTGLPVYARGDLVSLDTTYGTIEFQLGSVDAIREETTAFEAGRPVPAEAESFAARLALLQIGREPVEVVTLNATWRGEGTLDAVAVDHIVLETSSGPAYVRTGSIACVIRRT